jgi:hypothetical protein
MTQITNEDSSRLATWVGLIAMCRRLAGDLRAAGANPANNLAWEAGWKMDVLLAEDVIARAENELGGAKH